jgi:hypothetical protein
MRSFELQRSDIFSNVPHKSLIVKASVYWKKDVAALQLNRLACLHFDKDVTPMGLGSHLNGFQVIYSKFGDPQGSCLVIFAPIPGRTAITVGPL